MNQMFGIEVRKQLFPAVKRKRASRPASTHHGGMLANLVSDDENRNRKGIKAASRKRSNKKNDSILSSLCVDIAPVVTINSTTTAAPYTSSVAIGGVLADIGNIRSPPPPLPRSNKELKEVRSSVLAESFGDDKHDVSMSVFELISLQPTDRPGSKSVAFRRARKRPKELDRKGQKPRFPKITQSVLALPPDEGKENQRKARRGKRERQASRVSRRESKKDSVSSEVWYDCVDVKPKLCIPLLRNKIETRPQARTDSILVQSIGQAVVQPIQPPIRGHGRGKKMSNSARNKECDDLATKILQTYNMREPSENLHSNRKRSQRDGPGARVLEVEMLQVPIVQEEALPVKQIDDSIAEESAALMLIQLLKSKEEGDGCQIEKQGVPLIKARKDCTETHITDKEPIIMKEGRRKKFQPEGLEVVKRMVKKRHRQDNTKPVTTKKTKRKNQAACIISQPARRSTRQPVPTQRYAPPAENRVAKSDAQILDVVVESLGEDRTETNRRARRVSGEQPLPQTIKSSDPNKKVTESKELPDSVQKSGQRKSSRNKTQASRYSPCEASDAMKEDDFFEDRETLETLKHRKKLSDVEAKQSLNITKQMREAIQQASSANESKTTKKNRCKVKTEAKVTKHVQIKEESNVKECLQLDQDGWTDSQVISLRDAYASADPRSSEFWEEIASQVAEMDEEQCRKKWFALVMTPAAKKKSRAKAALKKGLGQAVASEEDDLFNATPMKSQLFDDPSNGYGNGMFDVYVGSPIVDGGLVSADNMTTEYDDGIESDAAPISRVGYKTYVKNLKRGITKAEKENRKKKSKPSGDRRGPRVLSDRIDHGDLEVKGSLTPGGTVRLQTVDWNESEDDFFECDEEEE